MMPRNEMHSGFESSLFAHAQSALHVMQAKFGEPLEGEEPKTSREHAMLSTIQQIATKEFEALDLPPNWAMFDCSRIHLLNTETLRRHFPDQGNYFYQGFYNVIVVNNELPTVPSHYTAEQREAYLFCVLVHEIIHMLSVVRYAAIDNTALPENNLMSIVKRVGYTIASKDEQTMFNGMNEGVVEQTTMAVIFKNAAYIEDQLDIPTHIWKKLPTATH